MEHKIAYDRGAIGHVAKKYHCPNCNKKRFVRFYNFETQEYLPEHFGKCDREDNCGYIQTPWEWLKTEGKSNNTFVKKDYHTKEARPEVRFNKVDKDLMVKTLSHYELNNFAKYLQSILDTSTAKALIFKYFIGTAKERGTIFWQVDRMMQVRTGQKIHYKLDGHRDKSFNPPSKRLFTVDKGYEPCLFGEHLIFDAPRNAIFALVESEKTAVIMSAYFPYWNNRPLYWLATCGMHGLTESKLNALRDLDVLLVPDFSFAARATWGLEPMRKRKNDKGIMIIDAEGEIQEDYISLKDKLLAQGTGVETFNPKPELNDGSDLADHISTLPRPVFYERPNFDILILSNNEQQKVIEIVLDASSMVYEKYGYGMKGSDYDASLFKLEGQIELLKDERTQQLINRFGLEPQFDF